MCIFKIKSEQIFYHIKYRHPYKKKRDFIRLRNESSKITLTHKIHSSRFPVEHEIVVNNFNEALKKISSKEKKLIVCFGSLYNIGNILNKN